MQGLLTYDTLDAIADTYVPTLVVLAILRSVPASGDSRMLRFALRISTVTALAALTYGLMYADAKLELWSRLSLDYSTHTALSLSLVIWIVARWPIARVLWWSSWALYLALMVYQRYHTVTDIVTTIIVIAPFAWLIVYRSTGTFDRPPATGSQPTHVD